MRPQSLRRKLRGFLVQRHKGTCYRCLKRFAWITEDADGELEPQLCSRCKWNQERDTDHHLTKPPKGAVVDGVDVEGYMDDTNYYRHHVKFSPAVDRREAIRLWREKEEEE